MITTVKYQANVQDSDNRRHSIPSEVIRSLVGVKERTGLDDWPCLLEIYIVTCKRKVPQDVDKLHPFIVCPNSGGEIRVKKTVKGYPEKLDKNQYLIVEITAL